MKSERKAGRIRKWFGGQSGQVEVETAIVMPAVVFLLLGLTQLGLLHQARLITKYAAYRAVRQGIVNNADVAQMQRAAMAAALPILSRPNMSGTEILDRVDTPAAWAIKRALLPNTMIDGMGLQYAQVTICGPLQSDVSGKTYDSGAGQAVPFDDPKVAGPAGNGATKLRIELTINYRMMIPFADWVIFNMAKGHRITDSLRLQSRPGVLSSLVTKAAGDTYDRVSAIGTHILPIRAQYSMQMHSDFLVDTLPTSNNCVAGL